MKKLLLLPLLLLAGCASNQNYRRANEKPCEARYQYYPDQVKYCTPDSKLKTMELEMIAERIAKEKKSKKQRVKREEIVEPVAVEIYTPSYED